MAPSQVGSVEFAASRYGTRLVVVMWHSQCGAVIATLEDLQGGPTNQSMNLRSIVDRVRPSVETLLSGRRDADPVTLVRDAVRANVRTSVDHLRHGSALLEKLIHETGLLVVGAEYSLETGVVDFFDGVPDAGGESVREKPAFPVTWRRTMRRVRMNDMRSGSSRSGSVASYISARIA